MTETFSYLDTEKLKASPTNPRKRLGDIAELVESVKSKGIIEPLVVRKNGKPDEWEIVCGWRRKHAAEQAGLKQVPAMIRLLSDDDVLDVQLAENLDRADLTPFEEAQAYQLRLERGQSVEHIADCIGRKPSYVAQRVKLLTLSPKVREALEAGHVTLGLALLIARHPDAKLQDEALNLVGGTAYEPCMTVSEATKEIEESLMMRLEKAPFDTTDAKLVPEAGACSSCPKRTGNQAALFADVASPDLCTDPPCFKKKLDVVWKEKAAEAKKKGIRVLPIADAKELHGRSSDAYQELGYKLWVNGKTVTVKQLFGKDEPPILLAQNQKTRMPMKVVAKADIDRMIRIAEATKNPKAKGESSETAADRKRKLQSKAVARALELAVEKARRVEPAAVLELVVRAFAARCWSETQRAILKRRGVEVPKGSNVESTVTKLATTLQNDDLKGLGVELAMKSAAPGSMGGSGSGASIWKDALKLLKIDFAKVENEVAAGLKATGKPEKKARRKAKRAK